MTKCTLVGITQPRNIEGIATAEELVAYAARVSNPANQNNSATATKLLKYLATNHHWSPFEMISLTIEIETTRDIARQILRHRSFAFQEFCIHEDSEITTITKSGKSEKVPIKDLYSRYSSTQYWNMSDNLVRVFDENTNLLTVAKLKEVFQTGIKPVYTITLDNGNTLTCTKEHKLLSEKGFQPLENLSIDNFVATNGIPIYQDKTWLAESKILSIETGTGLQGIADLAEISTHTIRKWLRIHGLQFSKKEVASYTSAWNKGLPTEKQPMFGKSHSLVTREKQSLSSRKEKESNLYSSGNFSQSTISWRARVAQKCKGSHKTLLINQNYICKNCDTNIDLDTSEVDHIKPVYSNPILAFEESNLQALCKTCHKEKTKKETLESKYTVKFHKITSIVEAGEAMTYDLEVEHTSHNYIANGLVTHNSQRYASVESLGFSLREARLQDAKNRQASIKTNDKELQQSWLGIQNDVLDLVKCAYDWALESGIAKEQARAVLPEGLTNSRLYMAGTLRSWIHYCQLRCEMGTQAEHREVAEQCLAIILQEIPSLKEILGNDSNTQHV